MTVREKAFLETMRRGLLMQAKAIEEYIKSDDESGAPEPAIKAIHAGWHVVKGDDGFVTVAPPVALPATGDSPA